MWKGLPLLVVLLAILLPLSDGWKIKPKSEFKYTKIKLQKSLMYIHMTHYSI